MSPTTRNAILLAASITLSVGSVACFPTYAELAWIAHAEPAPPTPLVEVVPPAPFPTYVWINGYWWWTGVRYEWVRGHWAPPPRIGLVWVPSGWILYNGHYHFVAGYWSHHDHHRRRVPYHHRIPQPRVESGVTYRTLPRGHDVDRPRPSKARPADKADRDDEGDHRARPAPSKARPAEKKRKHSKESKP